MKVQKTSTQPASQPIELKIAFESQDEYDLFTVLCCNSYSVSNKLADVADEGALEDMLAEIRKSL